MNRRRLSRVVAAVVVAQAALAHRGAAPAFAATTAEACAVAAESAQSLRQHGHLVAAQKKLIACGQPACPRVVREDCARWQGQLDESLPSVVVAARDANGADVADVSVTQDGAPFVERIDGKAIAVDPGEHRFRFVRDGSDPIEARVVLREGEKRRAVSVQFPASAPPAKEPAGVDEKTVVATPVAPAPESPGMPTAGYALGGVGVAALAGFAVLGITGLSEYNALHDGCGKTRSCNPDDVASNRTKLWIADGLLAGGAIAIGVAAIVYLTRGGSRPSAAASPSVRVVDGGRGALVGFGARF